MGAPTELGRRPSGEATRRSRLTTGSRFDGVVCLSPDRWGDAKRPEHLMRRLARRVPVLYVEPPAEAAALLRYPKREMWGRFGARRWRRALSRRLGEPEPGLVLYTPLTVLPRHRLCDQRFGRLGRFLAESQERWWAAGVMRQARRLGFRRPLFWFGEPRTPTHFHAPEPLLVYDCVDRWLDFPLPTRNPLWRERLAADEGTLLEEAGLVFCSSSGLMDAARRRARGPVVLLRNGVDAEHFQLLPGRGCPGALDAMRLAGPRIGYVGAIAEWFDFQLLADVAAARPRWSFVLVGPVFEGGISGAGEGVAAVAGSPNIHLLGWRDYAQLPRYLATFDAAIIPFRQNGLTKDTNPIKVYEYLAAGIPVVSTPLPEVEGLPEVRVAADAVEFTRRLEEALRDKEDPPLRAQRVAVASKNSWDARVDAAWDALTRTTGIEPEPAANRPAAGHMVGVGGG